MITTTRVTEALYRIGMAKLKKGISLDILINEIKNDVIYEILQFNINPKEIKSVIKEGKWYLSEVEVVNDVVKYKKYKPFTTTFTTSGKILIENNLRRYFKESKDFDVNYTKGIIECSEFYAKQGLLHGFVGNSCPSIYYSKEDETILIGVDYKNNKPVFPNESYEYLGGVVTDLWWYSICDAERINAKNCKVHEITAGTWELTHYYGVSSSKYPYAKLKLIK